MSEPHGNPSDLQSHTVAGPPEPKTPMWLPALGAALFLTVGLFLSMMPSEHEATPEGNAPSGTAAADAGAPARK
jgi:hypothetical protein